MKLFQRIGIHSLFFSAKDKKLAASIQLILGNKPFNLSLYRLALTPAGLGEETDTGFQRSNERLEFLGDAILGAVIAEYLFKKYPYRDEGFLTETRSKLVNRETLNEVGIKIGLKKTLHYIIDNRQFVGNKSLYGDILEAFLGAVYLDRGYAFTKKLVLQRILIHLDLEGMVTTISNHKSKLIEWSQREGNQVEFQVLHVNSNQRYKEFVVAVVVNGKEVAQGKGETKKKAEQEASKNACQILQIPR
ncbi:MAG: ribonuclease III [Bacteroidetes bacterium]|nr:ribonuclease III [Bacteroidota bacterium]MDA1268254.1 ribonuclease III [Bacteroidota bacterium]